MERGTQWRRPSSLGSPTKGPGEFLYFLNFQWNLKHRQGQPGLFYSRSSEVENLYLLSPLYCISLTPTFFLLDEKTPGKFITRQPTGLELFSSNLNTHKDRGSCGKHPCSPPLMVVVHSTLRFKDVLPCPAQIPPTSYQMSIFILQNMILIYSLVVVSKPLPQDFHILEEEPSSLP